MWPTEDSAGLRGERAPHADCEAGEKPRCRVPASRDEFEDQLLQIGRDCASRLKEPYVSVDHGEMLYDELGLPQ